MVATMMRSLLHMLNRSSSSSTSSSTRPLQGITVVELAGLAPVPFCGLVLADLGADVTVVARPDDSSNESRLTRGKRFFSADLKDAAGLRAVREMCRTGDVLLDPFRPGVLEKLGLDPVDLIQENKKLIIARITGYGQTGPMAKVAGHDINYVAMTGLLPTISMQDRSPLWPPVNLLADFGGGGLMAALGVLAALFQRQSNGGNGQIVDVSMTEGLAYLGSFVNAYKHVDFMFKDRYGYFTGHCPIYRTYETADGKWMAVGALERKFHQELFEKLGLDMEQLMSDPAKAVEQLEKTFRSKTRDEWSIIFEGSDACVTPVLDLDEVGQHAQHVHRHNFSRDPDTEQWIPVAAPRFFTPDQFRKLTQHSQKSKL